MPGALSDASVRSYRENGFCFPYRLMPRERALAVADRVLAFAHSHTPKRYQDPQNQLYLL